MPASLNTLGPNSVRITYSAGTLLAELIAQVQTYLLLRGWEVWDAAAGPSAICYRALQQGGTVGTTAHYHYMVLDYATSGAIIMRVWESWDSLAHVGTNKATNTVYSGGTVAESAMGQRVDLVAGGTLDIHAIMADSLVRLVAMWSVVPAGSGSPSGGGATAFFTRERSGPNDTLAQGYCSSGWLNTANFSRSTASYNWRWSLPRAPVVGATATSAESGQFAWVNLPGLGALGNATHPVLIAGIDLTTNKPICTDANLQAPVMSNFVSPAYQHGRIYAMTVMPPGAGAQDDDLIVEVDSSGFLQRGSGVTSARRIFASTVFTTLGLAIPW